MRKLLPKTKIVLQKLASGVLKDRKPVRLINLPIQKEKWVKGRFFLEKHKATTEHYDLSIIVSNKVYRVARSSVESKSGFMGVFPGPGEKSWWALQPEHKVTEVPNNKVIKSGYGAGTTRVLKKGSCIVRKSQSGNMEIVFDSIDGTYAFIEKLDGVLLVRKKVRSPWIGKHKMRDDRSFSKYLKSSDFAIAAKKDGAAVDWTITKDKHGNKLLRVFSYRPDAKAEKRYGVRQQIEHTEKLHLADSPLNPEVPEAEGRGELWLGGKDGLGRLTAFLNSNSVKARNKGVRPYLYMHDVTKLNKKDVSGLTHREKLSILKNLHKKDLRLKVPPIAVTSQGKQNLLRKTKKESMVDGVIAIPLDYRSDTPKGRLVKLKFRHDKDNEHEATIVSIKNQKGPRGEHLAYPVLENKYGARFVASGKGLTEKVKKDMAANPMKYIGKTVTYVSERHFNSGLPWQPTIKL